MTEEIPATAPVMLTQTAVLLRPGWSKGLVKKLLGEPDLIKPSYLYKNMSHLYMEARVIAAEGSGEYHAAQEKLAKRKLAAAKAVETKTRKLIEQIGNMQVSVQKLPKAKVCGMAIESYNERKCRRGNYDDFVDHTANKEFLDRITVNFIRHEMTQYDGELERIAGKTGITVAIQAIRKKVYATIAIAYPYLIEECNKQMVARTG